MVNQSYHHFRLKETDGVVHVTKKQGDEKWYRHYMNKDLQDFYYFIFPDVQYFS